MKRIAALLLILAVLLAVFPVSAASFDDHVATAYMYVKFDCGHTRCGTGAMIGRRGLITCAHNLYCSTCGRALKTCEFVFGAKSPNSGQKKYNSGFTYRAYDTFSGGYSAENDIGYVIFNKPVGDSTGWYGYSVASDSSLDGKYANVNYYTDRGRFRNMYTGMHVLNSNKLTLDQRIYDCEGGPVCINDWQVVAVYTSYNNNGNGVARRLTKQVIEDMKMQGAFD